MDIRQHLPALHEIGRSALNCFQDADGLLDVASLDRYQSVGEQHVHLFRGTYELTNSLIHDRFAFLELLALDEALGQQQEYSAPILLSETQHFVFLALPDELLVLDSRQTHSRLHTELGRHEVLLLELYLPLDQHKQRVLPDLEVVRYRLLEAYQGTVELLALAFDHRLQNVALLVAWIDA